MSDRTISWPGAKYRSVGDLAMWCPGTAFDAMCEPFWGTGALTLHLLPLIDGPIFGAEANRPLYNWWQWVAEDMNGLMERMATFRQEYDDAGADRSRFNAMRDGWNEMNEEEPDDLNTAALLWCLIYASTNNLARFNQSGGYNQTWGKGRKIPDPYEIIGVETRVRLRELSSRLNLFHDFREALTAFMAYREGGNCGMCYLDPPYILQSGMYDAHQWNRSALWSMMDWVEGLEGDDVWWLYTDYMRKGQDLHPYSMALQRFRQVPLRTARDARPTGQHIPKDEVLTIGSTVERRENEQLTFSAATKEADDDGA